MKTKNKDNTDMQLILSKRDLSDEDKPVKIDAIHQSIKLPKVQEENEPAMQPVESAEFQPIDENTEKGAVIKELNRDEDEGEGFSSIDTKSNLSGMQISGIMTIDFLVANNFLVYNCRTFTRSAKRLNVSGGGRGRTDIVRIMNGTDNKDMESGKTFFQRMGITSGNNQAVK